MLDELISRATALATGPGRRILGITGPPGAGKSTLAEQIVAALGPHRAVLVPMDGFHLANDVLERRGLRSRKGAPDTFDVEGYVSLLARARHARVTLYAPRFDRDIEESIGSAVEIAPDVPLVVTEGNYLLLRSTPWTDVAPLLDESWYVDTADPVRVERLVARHRHFGKTDLAAREWATGSDERNASLVKSTASLADLRITAPTAPVG